jgi:protein AaeX
VGLAEVNLLGVYVAPLSVIMASAWVMLLILRRIGARFDLVRYVWHPPLFSLAIYVILVSGIVLFISH